MQTWYHFYSTSLKTILILTILGVLLMDNLAAGVNPVAAQASEDNWSDPLNLSRSGAATDPQLLVDAGGRFHALWRDKFAGFVYAIGDGSEWGEPATLELPFSENQPLLVADKDGYIHAFWIDAKAGSLLYSQVISAGFSNFDSWTRSQLISDSAVVLDVTVAPGGDLHLAYVRNTEGNGQTAGIYYTHLSSAGSNWSIPVALDTSPYFRSLTAEDSNVKISAAESSNADQVYVVWDNRPRERVLLAKSNDGGESWGEAQVIGKPEESSLTLGPSNITVHAQGDNVLLLWQSAQNEEGCKQFSQWSFDGAASWQPSQEMYTELQLCPKNIQFIESSNGLVLVLIEKQVYLQAWDGSSWSIPQLQEALSSFIDPDTQRRVNLDCHQAMLSASDELSMINCGRGPAQDIWLLKRPLLDIEVWFPGDPVWSAPHTIASKTNEILNPTLVVDKEERVHAFWSQHNDPIAGTPGIFIFYSQLEGGQWSSPEAILSSPEGKALQPAAAVDMEGRIMVVWSGSKSGEIFFSQANSTRAAVASAWSKPVPLPSPISPSSFPSGRSPDILIDPKGKIYVTYAIPLNEGRGIFLTQSSDHGATWQQPVQVFDGVAARWAM
ncbi:MAG TPA: sialidase family protein, partial [Anaerolineales bacterium]|nr:sialidase family protein [Anaerolineales bacterium]